jgi:hypothetical protein
MSLDGLKREAKAVSQGSHRATKDMKRETMMKRTGRNKETENPAKVR